MSFLEPEELFKRKLVGRVNRDDRETSYHAAGCKQAVTKVGYLRGMKAVAANAQYVNRQNNLIMELLTQKMSFLLKTKKEIREVLDSWGNRFDKRKNSRDVATIILSTPEGTDSEAALKSARELLEEKFTKHECLLSLHTDTKKPHVHALVEMRDCEGKKLRLGKKDLHELRVSFAERCRDNGIAVAASYRADRGVYQKSRKQYEDHIDPETHRNRENRIKEISKRVEDMNSNKPIKPEPWDIAMLESHRLLLIRYEELELKARKKGKKKLAEALAKKRSEMVAPKTRLQEDSERTVLRLQVKHKASLIMTNKKKGISR